MKDLPEPEYYVEAILDHRGTSAKKSEMSFLVKWRGYEETDNSWEPWANLRLNDKLHSYLSSHGLKHLIPKQFKSRDV